MIFHQHKKGKRSSAVVCEKSPGMPLPQYQFSKQSEAMSGRNLKIVNSLHSWQAIVLCLVNAGSGRRC